MKVDPKTTAGRAFVRSLNILLKFARLYGFDHVRTMEQLQTAWQELHTAIPPGTGAGMLLGATGSQLLLDGVPLEGSPAEKQFAQLLSAAGLASIQFFSSVTQDEIGRFARAFPTGKAKPAELAKQLKEALEGLQSIRINEICFVATDSRLKEASMAAQLAAASLGSEQDELKQWLNDPQKLLELIAAAQGSKDAEAAGQGLGGLGNAGTGKSSGTGTGAAGFGKPNGSGSGTGAGAGSGAGTDTGGAGFGTGSGSASGGIALAQGINFYSGGSTATVPVSNVVAGLAGAAGTGSGTGGGWRGGSGAGVPTEDEILGILGALTSFGTIGSGQGGVAGANAFQKQVSDLSGQAQVTLKEALASIAAQSPNAKPDESVIVQLAEHLAIRYALERFERGEVKVNAVRQMLDRMNQEIENLRKILGAHEDKMTEAGLLAESHREILDRQFWAAVPESGKRAVLLSEEAWCIPPRNVKSYVGDLIAHGNTADAVSILKNYAACADNPDADARKRAAAGLSELAELYAKTDPRLLSEALRHLGLRLSLERDEELQGLVSAAFVRLCQQAATSHCYPAMQQALDLIAGVEAQRPGIARNLRGKMGIEERIPEFVDEALKAKKVAAGLTGILKMLPQTTMEQLAARFNRCGLREDCEHVANLASDLGEEGIQYLRSTVRGGPAAEAVEMAGLLSRLDPESMMVYLPARMKDFPRVAQDRLIRQISASGAPRRCHILLELLDHVDPLLVPLVIDEIGVTGDREALAKLLTIADGDLPADCSAYASVKAIEALGRLNAPESVSTLKRIAEAKKMFTWVYAQELRIAAVQALERLDLPWVREFLPKGGIEKEEYTLPPLDVPVTSKFARQRRHTRVRLRKPVRAISTNLKENFSLEIKTASLSGGVATISRHLAPGTQVQLKMSIGMRNLQATAVMRDYRAQDMAFEIVDINLEERGRLRRLLAENLSQYLAAVESNPTAAPAEQLVQR